MGPDDVKAKAWEAWTWLIFLGGHWVVLSAILNVALRVKRAEKWVELAKQTPYLAWMPRLLETLGVDPVAALKGAATVTSAKAAATTAGRAVSGFFPPSSEGGEGGAPPTPRDPSVLPPPGGAP